MKESPAASVTSVKRAGPAAGGGAAGEAPLREGRHPLPGSTSADRPAAPPVRKRRRLRICGRRLVDSWLLMVDGTGPAVSIVRRLSSGVTFIHQLTHASRG